MKKNRLTFRILALVGFLFCFACHCKKIQFDYSEIILDEYYVARISNDERLYLMFHRADTLISGAYFIYNRQAVVDLLPFHGKTCKNHVELIFTEKESVNKTKGKLQVHGDTVIYNYGSGKHQSSFRLLRENPPRPFIIRSRYNEPAFSKIRKKEEKYGNAKGYYVSKRVDNIGTDEYASIILEVGKELATNFTMSEQTLAMDIYQPVGDTLKKRPVLLLIHGGAFIIGDKDTETMHEIGNYFASRGYVVAAINYRLGYVFVPGGYVFLERCMYRAVQDARAALRYLVHHASELRIDSGYIFVAGNSAGGFTALKTAFMEQSEAFESAAGNVFFLREDLGCLDCTGNNYKEKYSIRGVINMWGALTDTSMISKDEDIPVLLFHGNQDEIVPPGHQYPFENVSSELSSFFTGKTYGSVSIHEQMQRLGLKSKLILFPGEGHDPQIGKNNQLNDNMNIILENMNDFLYEIIAADSTTMKGKTQFSKTDKVAQFVLKGKGNVKARWTVEGGKVVASNESGTHVHVVWFSGASNHSLKCVSVNENGLVNTIERIIILAD